MVVVNPGAGRERGSKVRRLRSSATCIAAVRSFRSLISYGASFRDENCKDWGAGGREITQVAVVGYLQRSTATVLSARARKSIRWTAGIALPAKKPKLFTIAPVSREGFTLALFSP